MKTIKNISFLLILFIVFSCKKPEESEYWTEVHVNATNYVTSEPLDDIYIAIIEKKQKFFDSEITSISEGFTDSNGEYYFGWKAERNSKYSYEYLAQVDINKYYQINYPSFDYLKKGEIHQYNIELVEPGYLNMNFLNVNCENEFDELRYRYYSKKSPTHPNYIYIYSPYWDGELFKQGCVSQIGEAYQKLPAGTYTLEWNVTRDGGYTEGSDQIVVPDGDSVTYLLEY